MKKLITLILKCVAFIFQRKNRAIINAVLNISLEVSNKTKNKVDNAVLTHIAAFIRNETKDLKEDQLKAVAKKIGDFKSGPLKNVSLRLDKSNVGVYTKFGAVKYNHKDGSVKWGVELKNT